MIGIQKGPPDGGFTMASRGGHGSREGDVDRGDGCEGSTGVFSGEEADQSDLPRVSSVAQGRAQSDPVRATEFRYERERQPLPRIDPWREQLDALLLANDARAARERLTLVRVFEELRGFGYEGSYDAVRRYARGWRVACGAATAQAFVPLSFAPGEAYQFDWSREIVVLGGVTTKVKVAHVRLCHSRMAFVRAYPREAQEMVFDAHIRAFEFFKGTCTRGIYDNMKTAVETVFLGKDRQFNRRFLQMCGHYLIEPVACTPAAGWEKGQVENQVGNIRERLFAPRLRMASYGELNAWLLDQCIADAKANKHPEEADRTIWQVFEAERAVLVPIAGPFHGFRATQAAVSKTCLVRFDNDKYSVAARAVGRPVGRGPGLCRAHRHPPGRRDRRRARTLLRPRPDDLQSLALRAGAGQKAQRS